MQPQHIQSCVVLGLGVTGQSVIRYLSNHVQTLVAIDSNLPEAKRTELAACYPNVHIHTQTIPSLVWSDIDAMVVSPGVPLTHTLVQQAHAHGVAVLGDVELFATARRGQLAAISGSNGKTTVTHLVGLFCQAAGHHVGVGGNIGTPALDLLASAYDSYVLECSSFQLETTEHLAADIACLLNISPDHLDRHKTLADYTAAKQRIYQQANTAIYSRLDKATQPNRNYPVKQQISFGLDKPSRPQDWGIAEQAGQACLVQGETPILTVADLPMTHQSHLLNALAACAIADKLGVSHQRMADVLKAFTGLDHRFQQINYENKIAWINDSKATNVGATLSALQNCSEASGKLLLILGGDAKGADLSELCEPVLAHAKAVIVMGQAQAALQALFAERLTVHAVSSMSEAVATAREQAKPGDTVLLSPACASIDMFKNYQARGDAFKACVLERSR